MPSFVVRCILLLVFQDQSLLAQQNAAAAPSTLEIPVQMSLAPVLRAAEEAVPTQTGNWRRWQERHGIQTQYRAWRGPLWLQMRGETLVVQAHVRYWIRARTKLLKAFDVAADCGVDEPPRQAVIGVLIYLRWTPDWALIPEFQILPTRFLDRCEMTIANIDVTPMVEKEFRRQLEEKLRTALQALSPHLHLIRHQAQRAWLQLQEPVALGNDNWLLLRPSQVALSPLYGRDQEASAHLAITLYPELTAGPRPVSRPVPLPQLRRFYPGSPGLRFRIGLDLDFAQLSQHISTALGAQPLRLKGHEFTIGSVEVGGKEQQINARVRLVGKAAGTAQVWAKVVFSPEKQRLELEDLNYRYEPDDPAVGLLAEVFYTRIREELQGIANRLVAKRLLQWNERLMSAFANTVPEGASLDFSPLRLGSVNIRIGDAGVRLDGLATGQARLNIRH